MHEIGTKVKIPKRNVIGTVVVNGKVEEGICYFVECYPKVVGEALKSELIFVHDREVEEVR